MTTVTFGPVDVPGIGITYFGAPVCAQHASPKGVAGISLREEDGVTRTDPGEGWERGSNMKDVG